MKKTHIAIVLLSVLVSLLAISTHYYRNVAIHNRENKNLLKTTISSKESQIDTLEDRVENLETRLQNRREQIENLSAKLDNRYRLYRPTVSRLETFVENNKINKHEYDSNTYNCYDYTADLIDAAMAEGMFVGFTRIEFEDGVHACVAFKTTEGIYYVEPQDDAILPRSALEIGDAYWNTIEDYGNVEYEEYPKYIITNIDILW